MEVECRVAGCECRMDVGRRFPLKTHDWQLAPAFPRYRFGTGKDPVSGICWRGRYDGDAFADRHLRWM
jgi:hypothetical protein